MKATRIFPPVAVLLLGLALIVGAWSGRVDGPLLAPASASAAAPSAAAATTQVSAGGQATCEVRADGTAWCAGENRWGQLGTGSTRDSVRPKPVVGPDRVVVTDWASISTSGATTCGIKLTTELFCWGMNTRGQLGIGNLPQQWLPKQVAGTEWSQVSTGWLHTCAVKTNGEMWCWGNNDRGQLGNGGRKSKNVPVRVSLINDWVSVTVGGWHTCGVRADGSAYCWGRNDFGQLGIGNRVGYLRPTKIGADRAFRSLDASWSTTCGLARNTALLCWGQNDQGQVGDGTRLPRYRPVAVAGGRSWSAVGLGDGHGCGLDAQGVAWCWGSNRYGQLGDGTRNAVLAPKRIADARTWTGLDLGWMHTCGLSPDNRTQCWGNNEQGQLGRGDRTDRVAPPGARVVAAPPERRRLDRRAVITSFNVLGSQHTQPRGGALNYAPGRIRSEWTTNLLESYGADIVAFQELQVDQYTQLQTSMGPSYDFYPATATAGKVVWQSVMWDRTQWEFVSAVDVSVPVIGKMRPNPMVRLRSKLTGKSIWVFNVHNSSKNTPERQKERNKAVRIEIKRILAQRAKNVPVVFLGDMNERRTVFCKVTRKTDLRAVSGGSRRGGKCHPPRRMRLDWIFVSPEFKRKGYVFDRSAEVARITDHSVLSATTTIPGRR